MIKISKSIAIIRDNKDLLRLIPFNASEKSYDFKIALLNNNYTLRLKPMGTDYFWNLDTDINNYEITYHQSTENEPVKLHFKNTKKKDDYSTFPLKNLIDPIISKKIPFPLFQIGISLKDEFKIYNYKSKHACLDLGKHNVVEVYIVDKEFDEESFLNDWSIFSLLLIILPLEYFTNGRLNSDILKVKMFQAQNKGVFMKGVRFDVSDKLAIKSNSYTDTYIDGEKQKSYIQFFDNVMYLKYLACVPLQYKYNSGVKSEKRRAYEWQLERLKGKLSKKEYDYYEEIFRIWHNEIEERGIKLDGITLRV